MTAFNYIDITLSRSTGSVTQMLYHYPSEGTADDDDALFDAKEAIGSFLNIKECYTLWSTPKGHYFALITPGVGEGGDLLLTLRFNDGAAMPGRSIVTLLAELKKTLVEDRDRRDDAVERCIQACGVAEEPLILESWRYSKPLTSAAAQKKPLCYRTYVSSNELDSILSFPVQVEYACYDRVLVVPATASLRPAMRLDRITAPIKRTYTVVAPTGITVSKTVVSEGDRMQITFTKPGFNPRKETISVGAPSPYVRYEGAAVKVKSPGESGLNFIRRVKVVVKSAKGGLVTGYTLNVNGRPVNTMEPFIELTEHDMSPGMKTEIQVASNNYRPLKAEMNPAELSRREELELVLEPIEQGITLRLDFGEGRVFEQQISLEKNTPEYSQLHSGNFHGFRANRVTIAGAETYNIDVKSGARPTPPAFANVASTVERGPVKSKAPVFEKDTPDIREKRRRERAMSRENNEIASDEIRSTKATDKQREQTQKGPWVKYAAGLLTAIIVIIVLVVWLAGGDKTPEKEEQLIGASSTDLVENPQGSDIITSGDNAMGASSAEANNQPTDNATTPANTSDAQADAAYLNSNDRTWDSSQLRTEQAKALISAMESGNIEAVVASEYFMNDKDLTNTKARAVADMLWGAKGTPNQSSNEKSLKKFCKDGKVQLHDLYEDLARRKPANPNPAPRPRH